MLEIHDRSQAVSKSIPDVEFLRIELAPLADGQLFVSLTATTVDDQEAQLLDQEVASERIGTIEELMTLIKAHVRVGAKRNPLLSYHS